MKPCHQCIVNVYPDEMCESCFKRMQTRMKDKERKMPSNGDEHLNLLVAMLNSQKQFLQDVKTELQADERELIQLTKEYETSRNNLQRQIRELEHTLSKTEIYIELVSEAIEKEK